MPSSKRHITFKSAVFLAVAMAFSLPAFSLGGLESLTGNDRKLADTVKKKLQVSDEAAYDLYQRHLASLFNTKDWQFDTFENDSLTSSKTMKSDTRELHISAVTDNRFFTVSFVKFMPEEQVHIFTAEMLPRPSNVVIEKHESLKKDSDFEITGDRPSFSTFRKKGQAIRNKLLTNSMIGGLMYSTFSIYDLAK